MRADAREYDAATKVGAKGLAAVLVMACVGLAYWAAGPVGAVIAAGVWAWLLMD